MARGPASRARTQRVAVLGIPTNSPSLVGCRFGDDALAALGEAATTAPMTSRTKLGELRDEVKDGLRAGVPRYRADIADASCTIGT